MRIYHRKENSLAWKGGKTRDHGYVLVLLQPDDFFYAMANNKSYVREHRLVMAKHLKRCLLPWEIVHHRNGIKDDNRLDNLQLFPTNRSQQPDMQLKARIKQLEKQLLNERKAGIRELGKRLKQVRDESYDEQTFREDLNDLIKLALDGKVLPPIVVECIETIWENPKFKKPSPRNGGYK